MYSLKNSLTYSSKDIDVTFIIDLRIYGINMSYPSIEIVCGKCGCMINKMINLKSIKDVLRSSNGRCNTCGIQLNATEFTVKTEKH